MSLNKETYTSKARDVETTLTNIAQRDILIPGMD